ncbi:MAG: aldo/keto reductase [Alphaproteobacteria bacterium]|nr:aldo/keto reductase [Alphaproteobacteria bacterium]
MSLNVLPPMRALGRTGIAVPTLGFGVSGPHGGIAPPRATERLILDCLEAGFGLFDTAPFYGDAETRLGSALRRWRGAPPFVVTKVGTIRRGASLRKCFDIPAIYASVEISRAKTGIDRLGALLLHGPPPEAAENPALRDGLLALKEKGHVAAVGVCGRGAEIVAFASSQWIDVIQAPLAASSLAAEKEIGFLAIQTMRAQAGTLRPPTRIEDLWYLARAVRDRAAAGLAPARAPSAAVPVEGLRAALTTKGVTAVIATTVRRHHLAQNIKIAREISE